MAFFTYGLIGGYAVLIAIAGVVQWKDTNYRILSGLFVLLSLSMAVTIIIPDNGWLFAGLILELLLLSVLAVAEGFLTKGRLAYSHHMVRFIFHGILILLLYNFIIK